MRFAGITTLRGAVTAALVGAFAVAAPLELYAQNIEEIVVKARKKEESIQEVPLAVTAVSAGMLEQMNLRDLDDIAKLTPGMTFDPEFSRTSNRPVIRGQANILGASGVSYFIDGVYVTGSINDYDINDVERMEIVKGPQSALYGRNTYSGAINIITKSPGDSWTGRAYLQATDDSSQTLSATIKGPLGDAFGIGVTGRYYNGDGFWTNSYDGSDIGKQESKSMSAVMDFHPSDRFNARARVYYSETRDGQPALFAQRPSENNCFEDNGSSYNGLGRYYCGVVAPAPINTNWMEQVPDARDENDTLQTSLVMDFALTDNVDLTSVTGYNKVDAAFVTDGDYDDFSFSVFNFTPSGFPYAGFPVPPFDYAYVGTMVDFTFAGQDEIDDVSQELRLSWSGDNSEYLIGAYYFDQDTTSSDIRTLTADNQATADANWFTEFLRMQDVCANNPICASMAPFFSSDVAVPRNVTTNNIRNTALFGMADFTIGDVTHLRIEGRWAEEKIQTHTELKDLDTLPEDIVYVDATATYTSFNPRVTLSRDIGENHMVYLLYAEGNKPGGFNNATAIQVGLPDYNEEDVQSVEFGSKNVVADGQLVANFAMYYNQVTGYQLTQNAQLGANTTSATVNAGDADIFGAEFEFRYMPASVDGLAFMMNYAYTDAEFVAGTDENLGLLNDVAHNGSIGGVEQVGLVDCSLGDQFNPDFVYGVDECDTSSYGSIVGKKIPRSAEHQFFIDGEFRRPMGSGDWDWYVGANYSYESSKFGQVANYAETGDASVVNARFGFQSNRYHISLWGRNLTGEDSTPLVLRYADGSQRYQRNFVGSLRRDTYYGLTATANFN